jgi:uncharacterized membrane protein YgcG
MFQQYILLWTLFSKALLTYSISKISSTTTTQLEWTPINFPNPRIDLELCGRRGVESRVCDPNALISYESANKIEELIKTIQKDYTSSCGGFQVAVVIVQKIKSDWPTGSTDRETAARYFTTKIHDEWGVGNHKCQDGIVLFLSKEDKKMYISTGSGSKQFLSNRGIERVLTTMRTELRKGNFGEGVILGINAIAKELSTGKTGDSHGEESTSTEDYLMTAIAWLVCIGICIMFFSSNISKHNEYNEVKKKLKRLDRERALARSRNYQQTSCPVCLEDFTADDNDENGQPVRAPDLLRCGHKFCRECLNEWMKRQQTCPICRQPVVKVGSSERITTSGPPPEAGTPETEKSATAAEAEAETETADGGEGERKDNGVDEAERLDEEYKRTEASLTSSSPISSTFSTNTKTRTRVRHRFTHHGTHQMHRPFDEMEFAFRLASLQRMHPSYITNSDVSRWSSSNFQGEMVNDSTFIERVSPSYNDYRGTGSTGFSSNGGGDFGGGNSSSGGGGGGGW